MYIYETNHHRFPTDMNKNLCKTHDENKVNKTLTSCIFATKINFVMKGVTCQPRKYIKVEQDITDSRNEIGRGSEVWGSRYHRGSMHY